MLTILIIIIHISHAPYYRILWQYIKCESPLKHSDSMQHNIRKMSNVSVTRKYNSSVSYIKYQNSMIIILLHYCHNIVYRCEWMLLNNIIKTRGIRLFFFQIFLALNQTILSFLPFLNKLISVF